MKYDEKTAGAVLLKNLDIFNKTAVYFENEISNTIFSEVSHAVKAWADGREWHFGDEGDGCFEELWVAPGQWKNGENNYYAWFQLQRRYGHDSASYEIADLFGVGQTEFGIVFLVDHSEFGGRKAWNGYAKTLDEIGMELGKRGWAHSGKGVFFLPLMLPADRLSDAWESEEWSAVVEPLERALEQLVHDIPVFDRLIEGAKSVADK